MKILFFGDAIGELNNCIAIAQACVEAHHEVLFMVTPSFESKILKAGFGVRLIQTKDKVIDFEDHVNDNVSEWNKSPLEQIDGLIAPYYKEVINGSIQYTDSMTHIIKDYDPDCIIADEVITYPAIYNAGKPWLRIISCGETEIPDPNIPPYLSGLGIESNRASREQFSSRLSEAVGVAHTRFNDFLASHNIPRLPVGQLIHPSIYLNAILTPKRVALPRNNDLPSNYIYLNGCIRKTPDFDLPSFDVKYRDFPLVYFSFGTMGTQGIDFTQSVLSAFKNKPFRVIASLGKDWLNQYKDLPDNIRAYEHLPQPAVIKQCDIVVFHGGNNTNNECYFYGKPTIVIPIYWDQHAIAQHRAEMQHGIYIKRKNFTPIKLIDCISQLLINDKIKQTLATISFEMQKKPGANQILEELNRLEVKSKKDNVFHIGFSQKRRAPTSTSQLEQETKTEKQITSKQLKN